MRWIQLLVTGIAVGSVYSLVALGYLSIYRTARIVNLAQGAFVMFGGFFTYSFLAELGLPYWLSAIVGIIGVVIVGVGMHLLILKRLIRANLGAKIMATIALSIVFENFALLRWGGYGKTLPAFTGDQAIFIGRIAIFRQYVWVVGLLILVVVGLWALNRFTRTGKQMTATANNPAAASLSGVKTGRMIVLAFAISAAIGALGGIAITPTSQMLYLSGGLYALNGFVAAVLGGWGSAGGAIVGGLVLGVVQSLASGVLPAGYQDAVSFVILIVMLYFRPTGLLGLPQTGGED
jgi:branched-chain amino acid transport system permease protein